MTPSDELSDQGSSSNKENERSDWGTIGKRLRSVRGDSSRADFARRLGIAPSTLQRYEAGERVPDAELLTRLWRQLGADPLWVLTGENRESTQRSPNHSLQDFALIPRYDIHVSTGHGAIVEQENEVQRLAFRMDWLQREGLNADHLVLVSTKGDSMEPTIGNGDLVLVDTSRNDVHDDSIYVLRVDGDVFAKRLQRDWSGGLWVRSDNPQYQDQHITEEDYKALKIVGRVVWIGRRV